MNRLPRKNPAHAALPIVSRVDLPPQIQVALDAAETAGLGVELAATTSRDYAFVYGDPSIPSPVFELLNAVGFVLRIEAHNNGCRVVASYAE